MGSTTVSRVINGGERVGSEMLAHVQRVMQELGYQPNQAARALKSARSKTIGLIVPSIIDPFFATFAAVAEQVARQQDYALLLLTSGDRAERGTEDLQILERHRVDGVLLVPPRTGSKALLEKLTQLGAPVIAFDRPLVGRSCSRILCDNFQAAATATRHLIDHGRRRFLLLGGDPRLYTIQQRLEGARKVITDAGLQHFVEMEAASYEVAEAAINRHLKQKGGIDAIFALYNQAAIRAYEVLQNRNIPVPERISLIGFDDFSLASTLRPSITVVSQAIEEMAQVATRLLLQSMAGEITAPQHIEIAAQLILRQSCGCTHLA